MCAWKITLGQLRRLIKEELETSNSKLGSSHHHASRSVRHCTSHRNSKLRSLKSGDIINDEHGTYKVWKIDHIFIRPMVAWDIVASTKGRNPLGLKSPAIVDASSRTNSRDIEEYLLGEFTFEQAHVRCVDPSVITPKTKDINNKTFVRFVDGDEMYYDAMLDEDPWMVDIDAATVESSDEEIHKSGMADVKGFKKPELMAYVAYVNGPLSRKDVLRQVSALEEKPYMPGSNFSYFPGVVDKGYLMQVGKKGNAELYSAGDVGLNAAKQIFNKIGKEPAKNVK